MKKILVMAATAMMAFGGNTTALCQDAGEQFSVATLNVDGLPQKILMVKVNADGPGDIGTARIGKYLAKKGYDLVMMQEDFNYHGVLSVFLEDDYKLDEWSGDVGLDGHKIDFLHLQNHRFECDGLMACWKNDLTVTSATRTAWTQNFGKFSHANDEMITKGFRRYEVTLRDGTDIVVYNMHMDATLNEDEAEGKGDKDREARMAQWAQLKEDVLQQLDSRPIIIAGDMNSLYGRDDVKGEFIEAINGTGLATVADVWIELQQNGVYPTAKTEAEAGDETLDKILYINPTEGSKIQPVSISIDREGYLYDGKPLGDHWPVAVKFQVASQNVVGISELDIDGKGSDMSNSSIYTIDGRKVVNSSQRKGLYIERNGDNSKKRIVK